MKNISKVNLLLNDFDRVSAKDINNANLNIESVQRDVLSLYDDSFRDNCFFVLDNNPNINSLFIDMLDTPYHIFKSQSLNIKFDNEEKCVTLEPNSSIMSGIFQTTKYESKYSKLIGDFILFVNDVIPKGCRINYFVSSNGKDFYPIPVGGSIPTRLQFKGNNIYLKAQLFKNAKFESPKIFSWCLLYYDGVIDNLSVINVTVPKDSTTYLFRDNTKQDKLVRVLSEDDEVNLIYDEEKDRLDKIITVNEVTQLNYGTYLNSNGVEEEVLLSIHTKEVSPE